MRGCPCSHLTLQSICLHSFENLAEKAARFAGQQDNQLQPMDALLHTRTSQIPMSKAVMNSAERLDPEAGGVKAANLSICIEDMLLHHLHMSCMRQFGMKLCQILMIMGMLV